MEKKTIYSKLLEVKKAGIKLQRDTKAFNYKYATLDQIQTKLNPEFEKHNLLVLHFIKDNKVITQIRDTEGDGFVESEIIMSEDVKAQDKGSEITYFRRYNLLSLLDLEVEDDDGKKAQDSSKKEEQPKKWLNYETFKEIVDSGNTTEQEIADIIKQDGFTLSNQAKIAVRHYITTGEIDKNLFFKK